MPLGWRGTWLAALLCGLTLFHGKQRQAREKEALSNMEGGWGQGQSPGVAFITFSILPFSYSFNLLELRLASVLEEKVHFKLCKQGVALAASAWALSLSALLLHRMMSGWHRAG